MFITSNIGGDILCFSFEEYQEHIKMCINNHTDNEIWCSHNNTTDDFPCLSILVKNEQAVVNYFSDDNKQMFVSVGDLTKEDTIKFENGQYEIAAYQIIPASLALECALQFFHSQENLRVLCGKSCKKTYLLIPTLHLK